MNPRLELSVLPLLVPWLAWSCDSQRSYPPPAQPSATAAASTVVHVRSGQSFTPACLLIETGATVEWRNLTPDTSISMLSIRPPYEISSPALRRPYNSVSSEQSDECVLPGPSGCQAAVGFSFWRHTFNAPGIFDYHDISGSIVALPVTSYGMPPGPSTSGGAGVGTVCVRPTTDSPACDKVCCTGTVAGECAAGVSCIAGRCGGVGT
jgi:hypothetical protein